MKIKTSELTHDALVCAVAMCEGYTNLHKIPNRMSHEPQWAMMPPRQEYGAMELWEIGSDRDWGFFGPIIEREKIGVWWATHVVDDEGNEYGNHWYAEPGMTDENADKPYTCMTGPTPLIAAMRCYVASKLGDEVEIPEELE